MNVFEIITGALLLIACVVIVVVVMLQESKQAGMGQSLGGTSSDSYYGKNSGRTLDAMLAKITKIAAVCFFVLTILVSVFSVYIK